MIYRRICITDTTLPNGQKLERGKEYLTSSVDCFCLTVYEGDDSTAFIPAALFAGAVPTDRRLVGVVV
jgi:hypothetical protein